MSDLKKFRNKKEKTMTRVALTLDEDMLDKLDSLCVYHGFEKRTALIYALINQANEESQREA